MDLDQIFTETENWLVKQARQDVAQLNDFGAERGMYDLGYAMLYPDHPRKRDYIWSTIMSFILDGKNIPLTFQQADSYVAEEKPRFQFPDFEDAVKNNIVLLPAGVGSDLQKEIEATYKAIVQNSKVIADISNKIEVEVTEGLKENNQLIKLKETFETQQREVKLTVNPGPTHNNVATLIPNYNPNYTPILKPSQNKTYTDDVSDIVDRAFRPATKTKVSKADIEEMEVQIDKRKHQVKGLLIDLTKSVEFGFSLEVKLSRLTDKPRNNPFDYGQLASFGARLKASNDLQELLDLWKDVREQSQVTFNFAPVGRGFNS